VTSPGPSPPRSKKESSDAGELTQDDDRPDAGTISAQTPSVVVDVSARVPLPDRPAVEAAPDRAAERRRVRESRRAAKLVAREKRAEARRAVADAEATTRAETALAKAAEQIDAESAAQAQPGPSVDPEPQPEPQVEPQVDVAPAFVEPAVHEEPDDDLVDDGPADGPADEPVPAHDETTSTTAPPASVPLAEVLAQAGAFDRGPSAADEKAADEKAAEKKAATTTKGRDSRPSRTGRARAKAAARSAKDDRIVEPPREPKVPLTQKLRSREPGRGRRRLVSALAGLVGAVGLICSVVLAFGALLVARDSTDGSVYDTVSGICDVLVGPLRDAFSFSGANADMKEALVAWGAGAIVYLVVGVVAQSLLRSTVDD
jgi:hypothetical protein